MIDYLIFFLSLSGIYGLLALGLNVQWGMTGLFNVGIAGFFAVGSYVSAILTSVEVGSHLGGYAFPIPMGMLAAMLVSGIFALVIGAITLRLRSDYLAIATIGIAEIIRQVLMNEDWIGNGVRGFSAIPHPTGGNSVLMLLLIVAIVFSTWWALERGQFSPRGRALRCIREREIAAAAMGKNVEGFRLQAFIVGSMIMGLAGALYAHFIGFISPEAFESSFATFLVWIMLIIGGSGNNLGALLGVVLVMTIRTVTESAVHLLPEHYATQGGAIRYLFIGVLMLVVLLVRPDGILQEKNAR